MNFISELMNKIDIFSFAQHVQHEQSVQRTLYDTVAIKSTNQYKDNAQQFFQKVMYENA